MDTKKQSGVYMPQMEKVQEAGHRLKSVIISTPLAENLNLSEKYQAEILLKREDLQIVRSYKIRGAYNKIKSLLPEELKNGVVCASAGNHAQGVAYSCRKLGIEGIIFMPSPTPRQKIKQVKMFGKDMVKVILTGDTYDDAYKKAQEYCTKQQSTFIHPFDDEKVIEGQATVGLEILHESQKKNRLSFSTCGRGWIGKWSD